MGKFEKKNRTASPQASRSAYPRNARPTQAQRSARKQHKKQSSLPLLLGIGGVAVILIACVAAFFLLRNPDGPGSSEPLKNHFAVKINDQLFDKNIYIAGVDVGGMTQEEALEALRNAYTPVDTSGLSEEEAEKLKNTVSYGDKLQNLNIRLYTDAANYSPFITTYDPTSEYAVDIYGKPLPNPQAPIAADGGSEHVETDAPLNQNGLPYEEERTLCIPAANVEITFDVQDVVEAAYQFIQSGKALPDEKNHIEIDISDYLCVEDNGYIDDVLSHLSESLSEGSDTQVNDSTTYITDDGGNPVQVDCIEIVLGTVARSIDFDDLKRAILHSYMTYSFDLQYIYEETFPGTIDLDVLYRHYECKAPVNAFIDEETYEITDGELGWGFRMLDAYTLLSNAVPGDTVILPLTELEPTYTTEMLSTKLFSDVLASYDSPHVYNPTRTHNLELACEAIDGTILKPGDEFSFNKIVGERTSDKGYGAAAVYVGGKTEDQLGGGVCQVASTVYLCTLMSDLEVVERYEHQFAPTYVPYGMDATVYWGSLDYRFRNNTPYPIRIDASVSDGYVHVTFLGTETKDYTVKMYYDVVKYDPFETVTVYIHPDMKNYDKYKDYSHGEVIQTAYTGYVVYTYMEKVDADGNVLSTTKVNTSEYDRRDREIAYLLDPDIPMNEQLDPDGNLIQPTEPESDPTEPTESDPTEPTETDPTETDPTENDPEPTESTEPSTPDGTEPTEPPTEEDPGEPSSGDETESTQNPDEPIEPIHNGGDD